jgi:hypothetical protein
MRRRASEDGSAAVANKFAWPGRRKQSQWRGDRFSGGLGERLKPSIGRRSFQYRQAQSIPQDVSPKWMIVKTPTLQEIYNPSQRRYIAADLRFINRSSKNGIVYFLFV